MIRMQDALTKYLSKQLDKLNLEMKEKGQELKKMTTDREELGVNLYGIQQQLAKQQVCSLECRVYTMECVVQSV